MRGICSEILAQGRGVVAVCKVPALLFAAVDVVEAAVCCFNLAVDGLVVLVKSGCERERWMFCVGIAGVEFWEVGEEELVIGLRSGMACGVYLELGGGGIDDLRKQWRPWPRGQGGKRGIALLTVRDVFTT